MLLHCHSCQPQHVTNGLFPPQLYVVATPIPSRTGTSNENVRLSAVAFHTSVARATNWMGDNTDTAKQTGPGARAFYPNAFVSEVWLFFLE